MDGTARGNGAGRADVGVPTWMAPNEAGTSGPYHASTLYLGMVLGAWDRTEDTRHVSIRHHAHPVLGGGYEVAENDAPDETWPNVAPRRRRLTVADVRVALARLGLSVRHVDGEYRVNYRGGDEGTAYYTTDAGDAMATGRAMAAAAAPRGWATV